MLNAMRAVPEQHTQAPCTFCGKHRDQVTALVAMSAGSVGGSAGSAAICVECLSLCNEIIEDELG
jgi:ATP-dependent protease Clp ATPase subunit